MGNHNDGQAQERSASYRARHRLSVWPDFFTAVREALHKPTAHELADEQRSQQRQRRWALIRLSRAWIANPPRPPAAPGRTPEQQSESNP